MSYRYTFNGDHNYLIHFNKNHSKANGQFISGDGDDDGIIDDHHHYASNRRGDTSGSNVEGSSKKKGVFSDSGRGRALKRGIAATVAVAAAGAAIRAGIYFYNKKANSSSGGFSDFSSAGNDFVRANGAKVIGGDW